MARVVIQHGTDSVSRNYNNTDEVFADAALFALFGASQENSEIRLNGASYSGPFAEGDVASIVQRACSKQ